jgi:hypothetical protein
MLQCMSKQSDPPREHGELIIKDEPGWSERFQRGLRRALNTPPQHRMKPRPKPKERPASKERVDRGKAGR